MELLSQYLLSCGLRHFMQETTNYCSLLADWSAKKPTSYVFFFMIATQGRTIKRSSSLDVVTLRHCSISFMASPPSIFAFLSGFCTQKSNYGLLYIKVLICSYGEGQRASFVCSLHWSQRSMQCYALHFSTFTAMFFNNCQCQA